MGLDLGLMAVAYQGAQDERRRLANDDYVRQMREFAQEQQDEYRARRDVRDSQAALSLAQTQARQRLVDPQTEAAASELSLANAELKRRQSQLPVTQDSANKREALERDATEGQLETMPYRRETALNNAKAGALQSDNVLNWADHEHKDNARKIDEHIATNEMNRGALLDKIFGNIYAMGQSGQIPEKDLVARFNSVGRAKTLFPELYGKSVTGVRKNGDAMEVVGEGDQVLMSVPVSRMRSAYESQVGKGDLVTLPDGSNLFRVRGGKAEKITDNRKSYNPGHGDALGRQIDRVMAENPNMSYTEALETVKQTGQKQVTQLIAKDWRYQMEKDPAKKRAILNEHRASVGLPPIEAEAPPMSSLSNETKEKINAVFDGVK